MSVAPKTCPMCVSAIVPTVVYGTTAPKGGACHTLYQITEDKRLNHRATVLGGALLEDCRAILQDLFRQQRALGKK